ncbi:MAG: hypothetical protein WCN98_02675 [Verrucomicrobiaceae bacterium]
MPALIGSESGMSVTTRVMIGASGVPCVIPLHSAIRKMVSDAPGSICPKADGEPFTVYQFHARSGRQRRKPGWALGGVVFHGLRKNATVMLLEAGCSEAEVSGSLTYRWR